MAITHLLLDIEGTTCPVSFVAEVLFPYARQRLATYLDDHNGNADVAALVEAVRNRWLADPDPDAGALLQASHPRQDNPASVVPYLQWLIDHDIKDTALKDLQGRIWKAGYASGAIVAPLFDDVPSALQEWHRQGLVLAVYSSGSIAAQHLLYGHTQAGDLRSLFSHWFDTRTGAKQETNSYAAICMAMGCRPEEVLFISDALAELDAAASAGLSVLFSDRVGNPARDSGPFEKISDYGTLRISHGTHGA